MQAPEQLRKPSFGLWNILRSTFGLAVISDSSFRASLNRITVIESRGTKDQISAGWGIIARLETKASAYLQHVSIMIAIVGLFLVTFAEGEFEKVILAVELVLYLALALLCIRCLAHIDTKRITANYSSEFTGSKQQLRELAIVAAELQFREALFRFSTRSIWFLTVVFMFTLFFHLLLNPKFYQPPVF